MVQNMEESLNFYQEVLGLSVNRRYKAGAGIELVFLGDGETELELMCNENMTHVNLGRDISLGFEIESLDKIMVYLKEKCIDIQSGPFQPNPHIKFLFVMDPNGLKIQLIEKIL